MGTASVHHLAHPLRTNPAPLILLARMHGPPLRQLLLLWPLRRRALPLRLLPPLRRLRRAVPRAERAGLLVPPPRALALLHRARSAASGHARTERT